jgi:hypothetical protein
MESQELFAWAGLNHNLYSPASLVARIIGVSYHISFFLSFNTQIDTSTSLGMPGLSCHGHIRNSEFHIQVIVMFCSLCLVEWAHTDYTT